MYTEKVFKNALRNLNPDLYDNLIRDSKIQMPTLMRLVFEDAAFHFLAGDIKVSQADKDILVEAYVDLNEAGLKFAAEEE
jgi:hypothetical protein